MTKKRILHVLGGLSQGGVENLIMNIYRTIDRNEFQFDFLVNRDGVFDDEVKNMGGRIYQIPALQTVGQIKYKKNLERFLGEHKEEYRIIHSHLNQVSGLILEVAKKSGIPIRIAHAHNNAYGCGFIKKLYKGYYLGSKICKSATCYLACSEEAAKFMFRNQASRAIIIKNGIPVQKFVFDKNKRKTFRTKYNLGTDDFVIGHVGRFEKQKNHGFLIDVFSTINQEMPNSRLVLLGVGSLKKHIQAYCKEKGVAENTLFLEPTEETDYLYCGFDAFLFPSLFEGLGMALVEAQTSGLYCYASADVIPEEACISNKLKFIPLDKSDTEWGQIVINDFDLIKNNKRTQIRDNPYDIKNTTKILLSFYSEQLKKVELT